MATRILRRPLQVDDDGRARRLNIDAAKMIRYGGLSEDEALSTITINGAKQLGIDKRVGSIEVGKDADIVTMEQGLATVRVAEACIESAKTGTTIKL